MAATPAAASALATASADAKRQLTPTAGAGAAGGGDTKTAAAVSSTAPVAAGAAGGAADAAKAAVFVVSEEMPQGVPVVKGYDFNNGLDYKALFQAFATTGFQATHMAQAVAQVNAMLRWRLSDEPLSHDERQHKASCSAAEWAEEEARRRDVKCTVFLGYTSNMISCGQREVIRYLCEHKLVDAIVTTAGGVEEDFIKCLAPFYLGDFKLSGKALRAKGLNRIGNLLVPNKNYRLFEDWFTPIYAEMLAEQNSGPAEKRVSWTPSKVIARLGERIGNRDSVYYWCWKNSIPVFCPALTDGSIGDMIFFQSFQATDANPALRIDIVEDLRRINGIAMDATRTGAVILGGGIVKHHICNANLMRNGADYAVYINTAHEWDGSDAGASPDEAISWGKIKLNAEPVKLCGEAALLFPILVAQTFAEVVEQRKAAAAAAAAAKATPAAAGAAAAAAATGARAAAVASNSAPK